MGDYAVAGGKDVWATGAHVAIDGDRSFWAEGNARRFRQGCVRPDAHDHEHEIGEQALGCSIGGLAVDLESSSRSRRRHSNRTDHHPPVHVDAVLD